MTTSTITKIQNRMIVLPKAMRKLWKGAEVIILPFEDGVYIKKLTRPSLKELRPKFLKFGKMVNKKELKEAIKWVRDQK